MLKRTQRKLPSPVSDTHKRHGMRTAVLVVVLVVGVIAAFVGFGPIDVITKGTCLTCRRGSGPSFGTANVSAPKVLHPELVQIAGDPRVFLVKDIVAPHEAEAIIREARPHLDRSRTGGSPKEARGTVSEIRTSTGMFMTTPHQIALVRPVAERVASLVGIPPERYEAMQVLRYLPGQHYIPHPDYFEGDLLKSQQGRGGQRIATIIMYLNDVTVGGETEFPLLNITVRPATGGGVLFWSMNENGAMERRSLHAGRPVGPNQEKWVSVYWMREEKFG